ncbi:MULTISPECIES: hypothetical protein [Mycobacteriaceae]|uniref:Uncharacterized protein n=2 Tax=Mycobacteriaceae TaxID=1762 RepID=A0A1X0AFK9_9MYCO|nr:MULTISPECIES: hypothetical protein [Mycobacteriaceae]MCV7155980.1 hypothetical protein [Mycolicibacterium brisbanense]ORA28831.1 hypothetical protein BST13_27610 [Mycobacterium aquaticum]GAS91829.1 putative uncharacterized protein, precursor [Mycolicibacterium brisbanense]
MTTGRFPRRLAATAGLAALVTLGGLTAACSTSGEKAPSTPTTTTTTTTTTPAPTPTTAAPSVAPTEKSISPGGGNLFTPTVLAPAAPTEEPGRRKH